MTNAMGTQKITVHLPNGDRVTEKDMYYLYYHESTGTFSLDYRTKNAMRNVTITSNDFAHSLIPDNEHEVHVFSVNECNMSRINKLPSYGTFIGNMLRDDPVNVD